MLNACKGCSAQLERLGLRLGFHHNRIEEIKRGQNECIEQLRVMLAEWLKGNYEVTERYQEPSQYSLCIAVAEIDRSLAETISNDASFREINNTQGKRRVISL